MLDNYKETDFMNALHQWDKLDKRVKCEYKQDLYIFDTNTNWRSDFKVNGGMILDGKWYIEN